MTYLNLGVLAHVDAGKTTLTERLLYEAGAITTLGSVDRGTTQTDTMALERQRGITIRSAVASFDVAGVTVNLIDTPGHADFIAEVERSLSVLDAAVLVVSAVDGVQPQTRALVRALRRLSVPTLIFVSKIDRLGADDERAALELETRLGLVTVRTGRAVDGGTRAATVAPLTLDTASVVADVRARRLYPLFPGSGVTGAGVRELLTGIATLLPVASGSVEGSTSGQIFKIDRTPSGDKAAYVRMFDGELRVRDRAHIDGRPTQTVTDVERVHAGGRSRVRSLLAGQIGVVRGLAEARVGDVIGAPRRTRAAVRFPPPAMESVIAPADPHDGHRLRAALSYLADQDPLIDVHLAHDGEISVSLYGQVQQEVIAATLEQDFGVRVHFAAPTPVCIERPQSSGEAIEHMRDRANPHCATVGLRVEPGPPGSGVRFVVAVESKAVPIFIYKNKAGFVAAMEDHIARTLSRGNFGWRVTDCVVTLFACEYYVGDGVPPVGKGRTAAADYRSLTPIVLRDAVARAGTTVCEPLVRVRIDTSVDHVPGAMALATRLGGRVEDVREHRGEATVDVTMSVVQEQQLQRQLSGATAGDGACATSPAGFRPVRGEPPRRVRRGG